MKCIKCGARARALDVRTKGEATARKRGCDTCGHRWSSIEVPVQRFTASVAGGGIIVKPTVGGRSVVVLGRTNGSQRGWHFHVEDEA